MGSISCQAEVNKQYYNITVIIFKVWEDWVEGSRYSILCRSIGSESILVKVQAGRNDIFDLMLITLLDHN